MHGHNHLNSRKTIAALTVLLIVFSSLLNACTSYQSPKHPESKSYPPLELAEWYGYSWARDTEFNGLSTEEKLSRITTTSIEEGFITNISAIKAAPGGGIFVVGMVTYANPEDMLNSDNSPYIVFIARYNNDLSLLNYIEVSDFNFCPAIEVYKDGSVYVVYVAQSGLNTIVKYDSNLEEICRQEAISNVSYSHMGLASDGALYISGDVKTSSGEDVYYSDAIIAKYSANLVLQGYTTWNGGREQSNYSRLVVVGDGSVFVIGDTRDEYSFPYPILHKYSADLELVAEVTFEPNGYIDCINGIATTPDGSVYIVYTTNNRESDSGSACGVVQYTESLEEIASVWLDEEVMVASWLPASYSSRLYLSSIAVDSGGLIYCIGTQYALTDTGEDSYYLVAVVLSSELSILNTAHLPMDDSYGPSSICLSDDADLYIAGYYSNTSFHIKQVGALLIK